MSQSKRDPIEALAAAKVREGQATRGLTYAAEKYALAVERSNAVEMQAAKDELKAAAKRYTNAMHQRSRCEKHVADQKGA